MSEFDAEQSRRIAGGALVGDGRPESRGIVKMLSDRQSPIGLSPGELGENIRTDVSSAGARGKAAERAAWDQVSDLKPQAAAFDDLPAAIQSRLGTVKVDEKLTPVTMLMGQELDAYASGKLPSAAGPQVFGQQQPLTMDQMRRRLLSMYNGAARGSADEKGAKAVYDGFNTWLGDTAKKGLVDGDPMAAAHLLTARDITRQVKEAFPTRDARTAGGRMVQSILDDSGTVSADSLVSKLFGNNPKAAVKDGTIEALNKIKFGLKRYADPKAASEAWNDVRVANWMRLVQDRQGQMFTPGVMLSNIRAAMHSQRTVMQVLYTPQERAAMTRFSAALDRVVAKDPNPSGSGVAIAALTRQLFMKLIDAVPYGRVALEYTGLPGAYGKAVANRAVSQTPPMKPLPGVAGVFGGLSRAREPDQ